MWWTITALAAPPAEDLRAAWERWRPQLDAQATYPFRFTPEEWARLSAGDVARRREKLEGTDRVLGMVWVPADLDTTWLAIYDPHGADIHSFTEEELPGTTPQRRIVYQRIDLPWPLVSRQWVVEVSNNLRLTAATDGKFWERTWALSDRRGAKAERPNALWLPINEGGWFLVDAEGGTLLGYHVRTVIGGVVPDEAAVRWSYATLSSLLKGIADRVPFERTHYVADHPPVLRPDGTSIPVKAVSGP